MTIRIPVKALLLALYTPAVLGAAFGISYAVFEWRDDSPDEADVSELEGRMDGLSDRIGKLSAEVSAVSGHSRDDCGAAIVNYVADSESFRQLFPNLTPSEAEAWNDRVNQYMREMQEACR